MPATVVPDNDKLVVWIAFADFGEYFSRNAHVLFVGHESVLLTCFEVQEAVEVLPLPRVVGFNDRRILAFGQPNLLDSGSTGEYHFIFTKYDRIGISPVFGEDWFRLVYPVGFCFWVCLLIHFARTMPTEVCFTEQEMLTSLGLVAFAELFKDIHPKQPGRPVFYFTAGDNVLGLFGFEDSNDLLFLGRGEDTVTVIFAFVFERVTTIFEVVTLQPFGVVFCVTRERSIYSANQQQDGHGAPGGCAIAELFLIYFQLLYLFLIHQGLVWRRMGAVASENVWSIVIKIIHFAFVWSL